MERTAIDVLDTRALAARAWVARHSGPDGWRVLDVTPDGFRYDGPVFSTPQWKPFDDDDEACIRLARGATR